jgi:hypothetical protein
MIAAGGNRYHVAQNLSVNFYYPICHIRMRTGRADSLAISIKSKPNDRTVTSQGQTMAVASGNRDRISYMLSSDGNKPK